MIEKLLIAAPHGFCAGVDRAIITLNKALDQFGEPLFVNHQIVHNTFLVNYFEQKGVVFEDDILKVPYGSTMIFSAHGVSPQYRKSCQEKGLNIIDATCPLVLKVHLQLSNFVKNGYEVILIGHKKHQEIRGTSGVAPNTIVENIEDVEKLDVDRFIDKKVVCLTQTTLSMDDTSEIISAIKEKIPHVKISKGICYASQNRQNAIKKLAEACDFILVAGSANSSNSNRLVDTAKRNNCPAILLDDPNMIPDEVWKYRNIGLSSGASVPEELFNKFVEQFLKRNPDLKVETLEFIKEDIHFALPNLVD